MALDRNNLVQLAKTVAKANPSAPVSYSWNGENFSYDQLNETLRREFNEYAGTYALYSENKPDQKAAAFVCIISICSGEYWIIYIVSNI